MYTALDTPVGTIEPEYLLIEAVIIELNSLSSDLGSVGSILEPISWTYNV